MNFTLKKINKVINHKFFELSIEKVKNTPPIKYRQDKQVTIVTMLGHSTVNMYLVAIKTFINRFGYGTIEVINDGTLTINDKKILAEHIPEITFSDASDINTLSCPSYISWKRLLRIAELSKSSYVIQLDSDTISLAPLIDIHDKVQANEGFLIGSERWGQPVDVSFLHDTVIQWESQHVQSKAEEIFKEIDFFKDGTKYLRACAGFAGYPMNFATIEEIENLSQQIEAKIGQKWHEWGSEQTATMCLISKTKNASVLPWPKYQNYMQPVTNEKIETASFVHFIGTTRFINNKYLKLCKNFLN